MISKQLFCKTIADIQAQDKNFNLKISILKSDNT